MVAVSNIISYQDFEKVDIRVGRIVRVEDFPEARNPSYKLTIDFGSELGERRSSARFAGEYKKEDLEGKLVACVINFEPKQVGPFMSQVLTLGFPDKQGRPVFISPERDVPLGGRLY